MRRPGTGSARRAGFRGIGGAATDPRLFTLSDLTFGRADQGSYVTSADAAAWYEADIQRAGTLGLLVEPQRNNYSLRARWLEATWVAINGGSTLTPGSATAGTAPDGTTPARVALGNLTTSQINQTLGAATLPNSTLLVFECFIRGVLGTELLRMRINGKDAATTDFDFTPTTSWARYRVAANVGIGGAGGAIRVISRDTASPAFDVWGACAYEGTYERTPTIHTSTSALISYPDVATLFSSQIPLQLREGKSSWVVTPHWAPDDLSSGNERWIFSVQNASLSGYRIRHTGTDVRAEAVVGGVVKATSPAITGSTRRVQRTILFDAAAGVISVNGTPGATGTAWALDAGVSGRFGGVVTLASEFDGYLQLPVAV